MIGSLQCFHLNLFVGKDQTMVNPYREMNTSLATVNYPIETLTLKFNDFLAFLSGEVKSIDRDFKMHNYNWYVGS